MYYYKNYFLENDLLKHLTFKNEMAYTQLCLPKAYRLCVLQAFHDEVTSGHMGEIRTYDRISKRFYWVGMKKDVHRY